MISKTVSRLSEHGAAVTEQEAGKSWGSCGVSVGGCCAQVGAIVDRMEHTDGLYDEQTVVRVCADSWRPITRAKTFGKFEKSLAKLQIYFKVFRKSANH